MYFNFEKCNNDCRKKLGVYELPAEIIAIF